MSIPDAAHNAATKALRQIVPNHDGVLWEYDDPEDGQRQAVTVAEAARRTIEAAMPAIREALAQELRDHMRLLSGSYRDGWSAAANRVEAGGTP